MKTLTHGTTRLLSLHTVLLAAMLLLIPAMAGAQPQNRESQGAIIRIGGNASLASGEQSDAVIVINGNAIIAGHTKAAVVINGTITLTGGEVDELTVINGSVDIGEGSVVNGDVTLIDAELRQAPDAVIHGSITHESGLRLGEGFRIFGIIFGIGYAIAVIIGGLVVAAIAPQQTREIGTLITHETGSSLLAVLFSWIILPLLAIAAMITIVGIPLGIAILFFLIPALGFLGYLAVGIRFGDYLIERIRGEREIDRPYRATFLGIAVLILVGWIPVLGSIISFIAAFIGSGAIMLAAWRAIWRRKTIPPYVAPPEEKQVYELEKVA